MLQTSVCYKWDSHLVCYTSHDVNLVAGAACAGACVSLCRLHHHDATLPADAPSQLDGTSSGGADDGFTLRMLHLHDANWAAAAPHQLDPPAASRDANFDAPSSAARDCRLGAGEVAHSCVDSVCYMCMSTGFTYV